MFARRSAAMATSSHSRAERGSSASIAAQPRRSASGTASSTALPRVDLLPMATLGGGSGFALVGKHHPVQGAGDDVQIHLVILPYGEVGGGCHRSAFVFPG